MTGPRSDQLDRCLAHLPEKLRAPFQSFLLGLLSKKVSEDDWNQALALAEEVFPHLPEPDAAPVDGKARASGERDEG